MSKNKIRGPPSVLLPVKRLIAIGDLHGDFKATIVALQKAKLIDAKHQWIGGSTVVVQVGDQVDRRTRSDDTTDEDSEIRIINLMNKLHQQARNSDGGVYSLLGNHELMNVLGDFTYTSPMGIQHFGNTKERYAAFRPGGKVAVKMAETRKVIMQVGDYIFVHGGVLPRIAEKWKLADINDMMRRFLLGDEKLQYTPAFRELFLNMGSLLWTRRYSEDKPDCAGLYKALSAMGGKYLVVGHTPQDNGINCKCKCKVWRIDTGMSNAFGKRLKSDHRIQVLEIINNGQEINVI